MKNKAKIILSIILTIAMVISTFSVCIKAYAASGEENVNQKMLDSILNDRNWIIDTLVDGSLETNPYNVQSFLSDEFMKSIDEDKALKVLCWMLDKYDNADEYLQSLSEDMQEEIAAELNIGNQAELRGELDYFSKDVHELRYESIINEILLTDYTSSWGESLFNDNMKIEILNQRSSMIKKVNSYQSALRTFLGIIPGHSAIITFDPLDEIQADYEIKTDEYINTMLDVYKYNLEEYLDSTLKIPALENKSALKEKIISASALSMLTACEYAIATDTRSTEIENFFKEYMCPEFTAFLDGMGKVLDIGKSSIDKAIVTEAMIDQQNTTVQTLNRIKAETKDMDMWEAIQRYIEQYKAAIRETDYTDFAKTLKDKAVTYDVVTYLGTKGYNLAIDKVFKEMNKQFLSIKSAKYINETAGVVALGVYLGDQLTGIRGTVKSYYIIEKMQELEAVLCNMYYRDLFEYLDNRTEYNAKCVLNDLDMLKKLRLLSEKITYNSIVNRLDSGIGSIVSNDQDKDAFTKEYQLRVDMLIGCSLMPVSGETFNINKGDCLIVDGLNGSLSNLNNNVFCDIGELDYKLMNGVRMTDAEIVFNNYQRDYFIPYLDCSGNCTINIVPEDYDYPVHVVIGRLINNGNLTLKSDNSYGDFEIIETTQNSGTITFKGVNANNDVFKTYMLENNSNSKIKVANGSLNVSGSIVNNGTVAGKIVVDGDGTQAYDNSYFRYGRQTIRGTGTWQDLAFSNVTDDGVAVSGTQTVTDRLDGQRTRIMGGKHIEATGNCEIKNGIYRSSITLNNLTTSQPLDIRGVTYIKNKATLNGNSNNFKGGLLLTSNCTELVVNGDTTVRDDMIYSAGKISGDGWLDIKSNLDLQVSSPKINKLAFSGVMKQKVTGSPLIVAELDNRKLLPESTDIQNNITITDRLYSGDIDNFTNGTNLILTGNAVIDKDRIRGSLSAKDWTCTRSLEIKGCLNASGAIMLESGETLKTLGYRQGNGTLEIEEGSALNCDGNMSTMASTSNNGDTAVSGDVAINGAFVGGNLTVKGNLSGGNSIAPEKMILAGNLPQSVNAGTINTKDLLIGNTSDKGVSIDSRINISDQLSIADKASYTNGKNLVLTGNAEFTDNGENNSVAASKWTCAKETVIDGKLYVSDDINISSGEQLSVGTLDHSGGTINVGEDAELIVDNNCISRSPINNAGLVSVGGDASLSGKITGGEWVFRSDVNAKASIDVQKLNYISKLAQEFTNTVATDTEKLMISNESEKGFAVGSIIDVSRSFDNDCRKLVNGDRIHLAEDAEFSLGEISDGTLYVSGRYKVKENEANVIKGKLVLGKNSELILENGASLTVERSLTADTTTINVGEGASLLVSDSCLITGGILDVAGDMTVKSDTNFSSVVLSGEGRMLFKGDLTNSLCTWNLPNVAFVSKLPQKVSGSQIEANNITIDNTSADGISLSPTMRYQGELMTNGTIENEEKLVKIQ